MSFWDKGLSKRTGFRVVFWIVFLSFALLGLYTIVNWGAKPKFELLWQDWFGFATIAALCVSILVLVTIRAPRFTSSRELLDRFIQLFEDALSSSSGHVTLSLLHLAPCPGLFDSQFLNDPTFEKFTALQSRMRDAVEKGQTAATVSLRVAMLGNSELRTFLEKFFDHETSQRLGRSDLQKRGGEEVCRSNYRDLGINHIQNLGTMANEICVIDGSWLKQVIETEKQVIILGAAERVGFLGSVSFKDGYFRFDATDYHGDTRVIHELFDSLAAMYKNPVNPVEGSEAGESCDCTPSIHS
jgi:hypothetical protein